MEFVFTLKLPYICNGEISNFLRVYKQLVNSMIMKKTEIKVITDAMLDKKAQGVVSLDLRPIGTAISDWFVVCNANSTTQVAAIAENVIEKMEKEMGKKVLRMQGLENDFWIILDYGDVVVHIFLTEYRAFYRLEDLWADAPRVEYTDEPVKPAAPEEKMKTKASSKVRASARKVATRKTNIETEDNGK